MGRYTDLEIKLSAVGADEYEIDLRLIIPKASIIDLDDTKPKPKFRVDWNLHRQHRLNLVLYGLWLQGLLFADERVQIMWQKAWTAAQIRYQPLRVRLYITSLAARLHVLCWESLILPDNSVISTNENILFSRFFSGQAITSPQSDKIRALVAIAQHPNYAKYVLPYLDIQAESSSAREGFATIEAEFFVKQEDTTFDALSKELHQGYSIFYLVCHGRLSKKGEALLYLGDEKPIPVLDLARSLSEIAQSRRPQLIVLLSCQSMGDSDEMKDFLATAGALLIQQAGIPAVIGAQGNIGVNTMKGFMSRFWKELQREGLVDGALSTARGFIRRSTDWWKPVLLMSLMDGRVWHEGPPINSSPYYDGNKDNIRTTDVSELGLQLNEWKVVHSTTQNLLLSLPVFEYIAYSKPDLNDNDLRILERHWGDYCSRDAKMILTEFRNIRAIRHELIEELPEILHSVATSLFNASSSDTISIRQLGRAVGQLKASLNATLRTADLFIIEIANIFRS